MISGLIFGPQIMLFRMADEILGPGQGFDKSHRTSNVTYSQMNALQYCNLDKLCGFSITWIIFNSSLNKQTHSQ